MYLCQHGVTLKYVFPIEIVIIGGGQFENMLNIGTVPLPRLQKPELVTIWSTC